MHKALEVRLKVGKTVTTLYQTDVIHPKLDDALSGQQMVQIYDEAAAIIGGIKNTHGIPEEIKKDFLFFSLSSSITFINFLDFRDEEAGRRKVANEDHHLLASLLVLSGNTNLPDEFFDRSMTWESFYQLCRQAEENLSNIDGVMENIQRNEFTIGVDTNLMRVHQIFKDAVEALREPPPERSSISTLFSKIKEERT